MTLLSGLPLQSSQNYRWIIVFAGTLGLLGALGLGRFALGVMLPAMGRGLELSYGQMGLLSAANFCGYLVAVLGCGFLNAMLGARRLIFYGLTLIGCSMILISLASSLYQVILLYTLTGIGSALANVPIMGLIAVWFEPAMRGRAAGLCVMGNGFGILISGEAVPTMNQLGSGWELSWLVFGGVVLFVACICLMLVRNRPTHRKGSPLATGTKTAENGRKPGALYLSGILYFLFGLTYVIYVTFIVTSLIQDRGFTEQAAGNLWAWGGFLCVLSGPLFGYISDRIGRRNSLIIVYSLQAIAYLLAAWTGSAVSAYLSIFCFSLVAFSIPSIIAALVGDLAGPEKAATWFGFVTFVFGIGQIAGPASAGIIAEYTGSFSFSFLLAAGGVTLAALLSMQLPSKKVQVGDI